MYSRIYIFTHSFIHSFTQYVPGHSVRDWECVHFLVKCNCGMLWHLSKGDLLCKATRNGIAGFVKKKTVLKATGIRERENYDWVGMHSTGSG